MSSAFSGYTRATSVEVQALLPAAVAGRPLLALTRGLAAAAPATSTGMPLPGASGGSSGGAAAAAQLTLPDGRLRVGTHLGLMAGRYRYLSTLGEGVSAQVVLAEDTLAPTPGQLVAIKAMRRQHALAGQREARALRFLHAAAPGGIAPGLVRLLDTFQLGAHFCLVTERLYPWLLDWVASSAELPPGQALAQLRKMAHQLLVLLAFQHNHGVVNADVKPDNILFCSPPGSGSAALRLVDLGNSFSLTETDRSAVAREMQTLPYRAPEVALGLPYGAPIDLFSCGVVLAEMALKRALFPCATPRDLLCQMAALLGPLPEGMVDRSALGRQIGAAALCQRREGDQGAAAQVRGALPAELARRVAVAAGRAGGAGLELPAPKAAGSCQLYAELAAVDASLADLVPRMLRYDPADRITAQQALVHPFFDALCPLRAVFPQLAGLCGQQEVAPAAAPGGRALPAAPALAAATAAAPPMPAAAAGAGSALPVSPRLITASAMAAAAQAEAAEAVGAALQAAEAKAALQQPRPQRRLPPTFQPPLLQQKQEERQEGGQTPQAQQQRLVTAAPPPQQQQEHDQQRHQSQQQPARHAVQEPAFSVQASTWQQPLQSPRREPPWRPPVQLLPEQQTRLPAAQLAARQWEEQRRLAAAQPYAGSFSPRFEPTPGKQLEQGQAPEQRERQQPQQAQHAEQEGSGQLDAGRTPESAPRHDEAAAEAAAGTAGRSLDSHRPYNEPSMQALVKPLPAEQPLLSKQQEQAAEATARAFDLLLDAAATEAGEEAAEAAAEVEQPAGTQTRSMQRRQRQQQESEEERQHGKQQGKGAAKPAAKTPARKAAKPAAPAAAGAAGTSAPAASGKGGSRQQQQSKSAAKPAAKPAARTPRKPAAGAKPATAAAAPAALPPASAAAGARAATPAVAARQAAAQSAAAEAAAADAAARRREQSGRSKQKALARRAEEEAQVEQKEADGEGRKRQAKAAPPPAAAAAAAAVTPRKTPAKAAAASQAGLPGKPAAVAAKPAGAPTAKTPAAKRKRPEPTPAVLAAAAAAAEAAAAAAASASLGGATALLAEGEQLGPPATAAKRQRRERQPGAKPWWVA